MIKKLLLGSHIEFGDVFCINKDHMPVIERKIMKVPTYRVRIHESSGYDKCIYVCGVVFFCERVQVQRQT